MTSEPSALAKLLDGGRDLIKPFGTMTNLIFLVSVLVSVATAFFCVFVRRVAKEISFYPKENAGFCGVLPEFAKPRSCHYESAALTAALRAQLFTIKGLHAKLRLFRQ